MDYNITITQKIVLCNTFKKKRRENIFVAAVHEDFFVGGEGRINFPEKTIKISLTKFVKHIIIIV